MYKDDLIALVTTLQAHAREFAVLVMARER